MKICFFSNFINHHQIPLCEAFISIVGEKNFVFVATEKVPEERIKLGYLDDNKAYKYVLTTYDSKENKTKAKQLALDSDIVIIGSAPDAFISKRLNKGKITFRFCERYFKEKWTFKTVPRYLIVSLLRHKRFERKKMYYLCASAFAASDINTFARFDNRTFKWGYFPKVNDYDIDKLLSKKNNDKLSLLWTGRLIDWKRPEMALYVAKKIKESGIPFVLNYIGIGAEEGKLRSLIKEFELEGVVNLLGAKKYDEVRFYMEKADIFLFTSSSHEGWGAVLNEAMNSGCAIVASHSIGSVPFLLKNDFNGLIYKEDDIEDLSNKVLSIATDFDKRSYLGKNAFNTVMNEWNAKIAASRFIELFECIYNNKPLPFKEGPCSQALNIKEEEVLKSITESNAN